MVLIISRPIPYVLAVALTTPTAFGQPSGQVVPTTSVASTATAPDATPAPTPEAAPPSVPVVVPPAVVSDADVVYPELPPEQRVEVSVVLELTVGIDGKAGDVEGGGYGG